MPWQLDGTDIRVTDWGFRAGQLTLKVRIHTADPEYSLVRNQADRAGDWSTIQYHDGRREVVAQSTESQFVTVTPPDGLRPYLTEDRYAVKSYTERPGTGGSLYFDVTLGLHRTNTRSPSSSGGGAEEYGETEYGVQAGGAAQVQQTVSSTDWRLDFHFGTLAIPEGRVAGGEKRARTTTFRLKLTKEQGDVILDTLGTTDAVLKQGVPDGDDYYVDAHPNARNTVGIRPPASGTADDYLRAGDYVVTDWRLGYDTSSHLWAGELALAQLRTYPDVGLWGGVRYGHFNYGQQ